MTGPAAGSAGFTAGGYSLVLPPGWTRVPVNGDTDKTLDDAIEGAFPPNLPRDEATPLKVKIKGRLLAAAADAREIGALDIYVPIEGMRGIAIPASFVVCSVPAIAGKEEAEAWTQLLGGGAEALTVGGEDALRLDETLAPDTLMTDVDAPARRITYLIPAPGAGQWITVTYSTIAGDLTNEFTQVLVDLFDAIMTTFRFVDGGAGDDKS